MEMNPRLRAVLDGQGLPLKVRLPATLLALAAAAALWLQAMHFLWWPNLNDYLAAKGLAPQTRAMAERHLELWTDPVLRAREVARMRGRNAEWDFMGRTFLVLALANIGLREPAEQPRCLEAMDRIIDETLRLEKERGLYFFLMDYARAKPWVNQPPRSTFLDGEIALMIGARQMLEERADYRPLLAERVDVMIEYLKKGPVLSGESYPDECWTFCNSAALAAARVSDALDGRDHSGFITAWLASARKKLIEKQTGLLIAEYTLDGSELGGPEGSTTWMVAHCLALVDQPLARDQYRRARRELARGFLGFGYAKEWPAACRGEADVDSGPVIPVLEISAGSSGLAFLGAATFDDRETLSGLLASLNFGGFPVERGGKLRYAASNQVGDAVILYALVQGPLWERVRRRSEARAGQGAGR